jgi:hypothetical protein
LHSRGKTNLSGGNVLGLAEPGLEAGLLEGAAVGEGEGPGALAGDGVHDGKVDGSLLLAHATRQEGNTGDGSGNSALEGLDGPLADLLRLDTLLVVSARDGHGGLKEGTLKVNTVLRAGLVDLSEDLLLDSGGLLDAVVAVHENLRLDDGDEASLLASAGIAGKTPGSLYNQRNIHRSVKSFDKTTLPSSTSNIWTTVRKLKCTSSSTCHHK